MVSWEDLPFAQLQVSCIARGLNLNTSRNETIRQLRDNDDNPRAKVARTGESTATAQSGEPKSKRIRTAKWTPRGHGNHSPLDTSVLDNSDSSDGVPTPSTVSAERADDPVANFTPQTQYHFPSYDNILRDFLDRERKLSLKERSILEREKQQVAQQVEIDRHMQEILQKEAVVKSREEFIGDIEMTQHHQAQQEAHLSWLRDDIDSKEIELNKTRKSLADQADRITQRTGTEKQQNEKEQRLGRWEYQLTKKEEAIAEREQALTARENEGVLVKLTNVLRDIPASQAETASGIMQSDFYAPRLSASSGTSVSQATAETQPATSGNEPEFLAPFRRQLNGRRLRE